MKIKEVTSKKCCNHWEKGKQYVRQIKYTNQGHLIIKVAPVISIKDEPVVPYDVLVAKKYFCWWLQINNKDDEYIIDVLQIIDILHRRLKFGIQNMKLIY